MYERFTDRARKVMQLANQEAQRLQHEYIGTEHILLGLINEGTGVAANALKNLDINLQKIRFEVDKILHSGPNPVPVASKLPHTPAAKRAIECAIKEARRLRHNYVGTEHLLLGLLREEDSVARLVLNHFGLTLKTARDEVLHLMGAPVGGPLDEELEHNNEEQPGHNDEEHPGADITPLHQLARITCHPARRVGLWLHKNVPIRTFFAGLGATLAGGIIGIITNEAMNLGALVGGVAYIVFVIVRERLGCRLAAKRLEPGHPEKLV